MLIDESKLNEIRHEEDEVEWDAEQFFDMYTSVVTDKSAAGIYLPTTTPK